MDQAIVLTSGGQDSTTCLAWAIEQWGHRNVKPISFDYKQRHRVELASANEICTSLGVDSPFVIKFDAFEQLGAAALTSKDIGVAADAKGTGNVFAEKHGLPSTFVPGRNMIFFTLAAAWGAPQGIFDLVTGVCETDRSGYPDCREEFVNRAEDALTAALDWEDVTIHAPLLKRSKADTWALAASLGIMDVIVEQTNTCYHGDRSLKHDWGYGCGNCPACDERQRGYEEYRKVIA